MRLDVPIAIACLVAARLAAADCPPDCIGGGGPAPTDCVVSWGGIGATTASCVDGDAGCDQDGEPNGVCVFPLRACFGVDAACGVSAVTSARVSPKALPASAVLGSAIQGLAPGQCTTPGFAVSVKRSAGLGPIKPGVARVKVITTADNDMKDPDKLTLTCQPASPSLANVVQPILTQRCTQGACHGAAYAAQLLVLDPGAAHGELVGQPSTEGGSLLLIAPGSVSRSFLARKVLGKGLKPSSGSIMPQGCPLAPAEGGCPTDLELYAILSWIQAGAPDN